MFRPQHFFSFVSTTSVLSAPFTMNHRPFSLPSNNKIELGKLRIVKKVVEKVRDPELIKLGNEYQYNGRFKLEGLQFGKVFTDHMFLVDWEKEKGWNNPRIHPYGQISIYPSAAVFHYGLECFEGMKAYKDKSGNVRLFRPDKNLDRFNTSSFRLTLPTFDESSLLEMIKRLVDVDRDWIPSKKGYSLYIRPFSFSTQPEIGVHPVNQAELMVLCSPVGPYYPEGFKPVSLYADSINVRAAPGGVGSFKIGGNYGPTVYLQKKAATKGFSQVLWLYNDLITEVGTMNIFVFWINEQGEKELVTPPLTEGTILPGVTRLSIIELARQWNEFKVSERNITITQLLNGVKENRVLECFGAGTAAIVCPIKSIHYQDEDYKIPLDPSDPSASVGPLTNRFAETIMSIQYGEIEHPWSVVVDKH